MVVSDAGEVAGSVSGGCVEGAVVEAALEVLAGDARAGHHHVRLLRRRGVRGRPHLRRHDPPLRRAARLVARLPDTPIYEALRDALRAEQPVALATVIDGRTSGPSCSCGPRHRLGTLGDPDLDRVVARDALGELEAGLTSTRHYGEHGEAREETVTCSSSRSRCRRA